MRLVDARQLVAGCVAVFLTAPPVAAATKDQTLRDAVRDDDVAAVRNLIRDHVDLSAVDEAGLTPLLQAIFAGHGAVAVALIEGGADVNRQSEVAATVLGNIGADVDPDKRPRLSPLMAAVLVGDRTVVERLVGAGANVDAAGDQGLTPLHLTVLGDDPTLATLLLDAGADVGARAEGARTPLHGAVERGNVDVARLLLAAGADVNAITEEGRTPLDDAFMGSDPELVVLLTGYGGVSRQEAVKADVDVMGADPRLGPAAARSRLQATAVPHARPLGVALDAANRKLYWTEFGNDAIRRADHDGSNDEVVSTGALSGPIGVALDAANRKLYWTSDATYPRRVQVANLDGSGMSDIVSGAVVNRPTAIAVDSSGGKIYWTEALSGRIRRANLDGSMVEDIVASGISSVRDRPDASEFKALGIAVDALHGKLYWTELVDAQVMRANLDGSDVEVLVTTTSGLEVPAGIALDPDRERLYWADAGAGKIQRARLDGSGIEDVLTAQDGLIEPLAIALDPAAGRLYWTDAIAGTINRARLEGSEVEQVFPRPVTRDAENAGASSGDRAECERAVVDLSRRYVWRAVNALATCLRKVDTLKAVWRRQSEATRAAPFCRRQLHSLAEGPLSSQALVTELRAAASAACATSSPRDLLSGSGPFSAYAEESCAQIPNEIDCIAAAARNAIAVEIGLRFHRAGEWFEAIRPFVASLPASGSHDETTAMALASLDEFRGALEAPQEPTTTPASAGERRSILTATGQQTTYRAVRMAGPHRFVSVPDDGALRRGNALSYVDNGDGTITDTNTGLMWEKKCDGCGGLHDAASRYPWAAGDAAMTAFTWLDAVNREGGVGYAGYTDWRLPSVKELQTIVDYERFNPATARAFDGGACGLGCADLETPECSCSAMTAYWSATPLADDPTHAFVVTFNLGLIGDVRKREENAVRAVRAIRQRADVGAPDASAPGGSRDSHN